jgi:IS30 family transposase
MGKKPYNQLTKKQREQIEDGLSSQRSISAIAREIGVSPATVSREIIRNRRDDGIHVSRHRINNKCASRRHCDVMHLCAACDKKCSLCKKCNSLCPLYKEDVCGRIARSPHVCNGCASQSGCTLHRFRYSAKDAQSAYEGRAAQTREGIDCTPEELAATTAIIKEGLSKGQGLNHIYAAHKDEMAFSKRSAYRHIHNGTIGIIAMELPKAVRYKQRQHDKSTTRSNIAPELLSGRTYADFMSLDEEWRARVVEMDCVVGPQGTEDAVLTLHFKALHFQMGIKLAIKDSAHVIAAIDWLEEICEGRFTQFFGIILCDRGSEFSDPVGMEGAGPSRRCSVYYTDPQQSQQKGACEKNHVELRKVLPKGTPLGGIDADVLADIFSHINSELRESLYGKSPFALASALLPSTLIEHLGYRPIDPDDVILSPKLLEALGVPLKQDVTAEDDSRNGGTTTPTV